MPRGRCWLLLAPGSRDTSGTRTDSCRVAGSGRAQHSGNVGRLQSCGSSHCSSGKEMLYDRTPPLHRPYTLAGESLAGQEPIHLLERQQQLLVPTAARPDGGGQQGLQARAQAHLLETRLAAATGREGQASEQG